MKRCREYPYLLKFLYESMEPRIVGPYIVDLPRYDRQAHIKTKDSQALVQMNSRQQDGSDFRIEFNPAKCDEEDMKFIFHMVGMVVDKRCKKIDLCINFHQNLAVYDLIDGRSREENEWRKRSGERATLYRGSKESDNFLKIYNKKYEQKKKKYRDIEHDWWRIEETIKDNHAENYDQWEWFKGVKLRRGEPVFPDDISPIDELVIEGILSKPEKMSKLKPTHKKKIKKLMQELKYPDEFDVCEELKKTDIVSEATSVIQKLLS